MAEELAVVDEHDERSAGHAPSAYAHGESGRGGGASPVGVERGVFVELGGLAGMPQVGADEEDVVGELLLQGARFS